MFSSSYERMLNKTHIPTKEEINDFIGENSLKRLNKFENFLNENYELTRELKFPFGNNYGWGYKYGHKSKHLCYLFFEKDAFTITIQIGDKLVSSLEAKLPSLSEKVKNLWGNRYPCGNVGGWIHYRVLSDYDLKDVYEIVKIKCKPNMKKIIP